MMKKPFIKKFRTKNAFHIYDVNSNEIIQVSRLIYDLIDEIGVNNTKTILDKWKHRYSKDEIQNSIKEIKNAQQYHHLFSTFRPSISSDWVSADHIKKALEHNLSQIILELTSRCNLGCKYCVFSGRYSNFRSHGTEDMPINIALKAVEYFIEQGKGKSEKVRPAISAYGGEPLLRFDLIKEIVALIKEKGVFDKFSLSLTTNGTLLTDEIISFFADNDISIMVSLDGPVEISDCYRVFPSGKGTFDTILANLKKIKKYSPSYFKDNVSINAVISPPYPFDSLITFFSGTKFLEPLLDKVTINFVNDHETTFFKDFGLEEDRKKIFGELSKVRRKYKQALIQGRYDQLTLEKSLFLEDFYTISRRKIVPLESKFPPLGTCLPGQRRIFVNTKGRFYMCERVGANYEIGDVEKGLDFEKIFDFLTAYDEFFKDCGDCWALRLCKKCFKDVRKGDQLDEKSKKEVCKVMLKNIEANLITYCDIIEENPDAFNVFEDIERI